MESNRKGTEKYKINSPEALGTSCYLFFEAQSDIQYSCSKKQSYWPATLNYCAWSSPWDNEETRSRQLESCSHCQSTKGNSAWNQMSEKIKPGVQHQNGKTSWKSWNRKSSWALKVRLQNCESWAVHKRHFTRLSNAVWNVTSLFLISWALV